MNELDRISAAVDKAIQQWYAMVDYVEIDDVGVTFTTELDGDRALVRLRIWAERDGDRAEDDTTYHPALDLPSQAVADDVLVFLVRIICEAWCEGEAIEDAAGAARIVGYMGQAVASPRRAI